MDGKGDGDLNRGSKLMMLVREFHKPDDTSKLSFLPESEFVASKLLFVLEEIIAAAGIYVYAIAISAAI